MRPSCSPKIQPCTSGGVVGVAHDRRAARNARTCSSTFSSARRFDALRRLGDASEFVAMRSAPARKAARSGDSRAAGSARRRQQRGAHAAASVVPADDHVVDLQHAHRVFEDARRRCRRRAETGSRCCGARTDRRDWRCVMVSAGTRLSEQPIHSTCGLWPCTRSTEKLGIAARRFHAPRRRFRPACVWDDSSIVSSGSGAQQPAPMHRAGPAWSR